MRVLVPFDLPTGTHLNQLGQWLASNPMPDGWSILMPQAVELVISGPAIVEAVSRPVHPFTMHFLSVLDEAKELHLRKSADYGSPSDPLAHLRMVEAMGLPTWVGIVIRLGDKYARLQSAARQFITTGSVRMANESLEDSLADSLVYSGLAAADLRYQKQLLTNPRGSSGGRSEEAAA